MPAILALETSTDACSVALLLDGVFNEKISFVAREHTKHLLTMLETLLAEAQTSLAQLDAIAFGRGPGSFTGLRICLSVAQGLAYGQDRPLIGISGLMAMANQAHRRLDIPSDSVILPILDARMNEVYLCAYRAKGLDIQALTAEKVLEPKHALSDIDDIVARDTGSSTLVGLGSGWHYPLFQSLDCAHSDIDFYPTAYDIAALALPAFERGEFINPLQAEPHYLRNEITWQKRQRIRS